MVSCKRWKTLFCLTFQWGGGNSKTKEDELDMASNSEFAENSTSCITARIIGVKHLIVRNLTYDKLTNLP